VSGSGFGVKDLPVATSPRTACRAARGAASRHCTLRVYRVGVMAEG